MARLKQCLFSNWKQSGSLISYFIARLHNCCGVSFPIRSSVASDVCSHMVTITAPSIGTPRQIAPQVLTTSVVPVTINAVCVTSKQGGKEKTSEGSDHKALVVFRLLLPLGN